MSLFIEIYKQIALNAYIILLNYVLVNPLERYVITDKRKSPVKRIVPNRNNAGGLNASENLLRQTKLLMLCIYIFYIRTGCDL